MTRYDSDSFYYSKQHVKKVSELATNIGIYLTFWNNNKY